MQHNTVNSMTHFSLSFSLFNPYEILIEFPTGGVNLDSLIGSLPGDLSASGVPHGHGTMTFSHGAKYQGQWREGRCHGRGTQWKGDYRYEGDFKALARGWAEERDIGEFTLYNNCCLISRFFTTTFLFDSLIPATSVHFALYTIYNIFNRCRRRYSLVTYTVYVHMRIKNHEAANYPRSQCQPLPLRIPSGWQATWSGFPLLPWTSLCGWLVRVKNGPE